MIRPLRHLLHRIRSCLSHRTFLLHAFSGAENTEIIGGFSIHNHLLYLTLKNHPGNTLESIFKGSLFVFECFQMVQQTVFGTGIVPPEFLQDVNSWK